MRFFMLSLLTFVMFCVSAQAETGDTVKNTIPESKNKIVKFTDHGAEPQTLEMKLEDSIVFFLNDTADSLVTLEVDYGKKETHCASSNLEIAENGIVRSVRPFPPKDFASVCFHDRGTYPVKIYGLKANPKAVAATIVVQ